MQRVLDLARKVAASDSSLLILGETGVGKEWLARAIHNAGPRASGPFIAVNCAAIPDSMLESELFGHEQGAFTGAQRAHRGYFEQAHGGTLFLDEIGEMPAALQTRFLRVLQEGAVQRLGSERPFHVDVRVMTATNRDVKEAIDGGHLRQDLYYRLAVVVLEVPPLRERREDIAPLFSSHVEQNRVRLARWELAGVSSEALAALESYDWPGNVQRADQRRRASRPAQRRHLDRDGRSTRADQRQRLARRADVARRPALHPTAGRRAGAARGRLRARVPRAPAAQPSRARRSHRGQRRHQPAHALQQDEALRPAQVHLQRRPSSKALTAGAESPEHHAGFRSASERRCCFF